MTTYGGLRGRVPARDLKAKILTVLAAAGGPLTVRQIITRIDPPPSGPNVRNNLAAMARPIIGWVHRIEIACDRYEFTITPGGRAQLAANTGRSDTVTDYDGYRDVIANWFDAAGYHQPYNAADRFVGDPRKGGFMVFPLNENWKRLDELEAERDLLRKAVGAMGDTVAYVLANYDIDQDALTHLYGVPEQATVALGGEKEP